MRNSGGCAANEARLRRMKNEGVPLVAAQRRTVTDEGSPLKAGLTATLSTVVTAGVPSPSQSRLSRLAECAPFVELSK